jgi:hypothetical protein
MEVIDLLTKISNQLDIMKMEKEKTMAITKKRR